MSKEKIILAMSGGLDSSICVDLLQKSGFEVIGVTFIMFKDPNDAESLDFINDAKIVAGHFGIKHYVVDLSKEFENQIINHFTSSYLVGQTPNPCVLCNPNIKWKYLIEFADDLGVQKVATGHYAVIKKENGRYFLSQPADDKKNQTYFLWDLPQEYLKRTIFPLNKLKKETIKEMAENIGLKKIARKSESYDICFIKNKDYRVYLNDRLEKDKIVLEPGNFVSETGQILGKHTGIAHYTVGQRKGLGVAMGVPYYVKKIDKKSNEIVIAPRENLTSKQLLVKDYSFMKYADIKDDMTFLTKIRYRDAGSMARVSKKDNFLLVEFEKDVFGVTPGQSAVFYENEDLVGGGEIFS